MNKVIVRWFRSIGLSYFYDEMKPPFDRIATGTHNFVILFVRIQIKVIKRVHVNADGSFKVVVE